MRKHHGNEQLLAELNANACRSKERHPSKRHAIATGRRILEQGTAPGRNFVLNAYKCRTCGYWHTGNSHRRHHVDPASIVRVDEDRYLAPAMRQLLTIPAEYCYDARDATPLERALADALRPYLDAHAE